MYINMKNCRFSSDGYVDYMSQCVANCPGGFVKANGVCEECIGDCEQGMLVLSGDIQH